MNYSVPEVQFLANSGGRQKRILQNVMVSHDLLALTPDYSRGHNPWSNGSSWSRVAGPDTMPGQSFSLFLKSDHFAFGQPGDQLAPGAFFDRKAFVSARQP